MRVVEISKYINVFIFIKNGDNLQFLNNVFIVIY